MEPRSFDALTQRFARAARETAGMSVETASVTAAARKKRKGNRKKRKSNRNNGDVNQRCTQQAADWGTLVEFSCDEDVECQQRGIVCAAPLAACDFGAFLQCLVNVQSA